VAEDKLSDPPPEASPAEAEAPPDAASEVGRLTGQAVNALGMRLLRLRSVRKAIRRGAEEVRKPPAE
jgi:hypothetical protein